MDENIHIIKSEEFPVVNLLSPNKSLEDTLNAVIEKSWYTSDVVKHCIVNQKRFSGQSGFIHELSRLEKIYNYDSETECITHFFYGHKDLFNTVFRFSNTLNTEDTTEDVKFRQEGVKEIIQNPKIANQIYKILSNHELFQFQGEPDNYYSSALRVTSKFTPEKLKIFLDDIQELENYNPQSGPIIKALTWVKDLNEDTLFREFFVKKRKITDSRLFMVFSERYNKVEYGILKPGIRPEEVFDFIDRDLMMKDVWEGDKIRGEKESYLRDLIKYKKDIDANLTDKVFIAARQRMDEVNEMTTDKFMTQTVLVQMQLQQLYQGLALFNYLKENNYPVTFPIIESTPGIIELRKAMPTRLVLDNRWSKDKSKCGPNDFNYRLEDQIIQIEGPNGKGKSEAWRTIHLMNYLINAGYPIPAEYCRWSVFPRSHFISCKGNSGNGGSELENSRKGVFEKLQYVNRGDLVILDELGDATNKYTAEAIGENTLEPLRDFGCKILITSHHDALTKKISENYGGLSLMPDPAAKENTIEQYRLVQVPENTVIDYKANEVLKNMNWTKDKVKEILSTGYKHSFPKKTPPPPQNEDDLPF